MRISTVGFALATILLLRPVSAAVIPPTVEWDAATYGGSGNWIANVVPSGIGMNWAVPGTHQTGATNFGGVGAWFNSPASTLLGGSPGDSWHDRFGDTGSTGVTRQDTSWEFVIRMGDLTGNHSIFDTGGSTIGTALVSVGSTLEFRTQAAISTDRRLFLSTDLSALGIDPATDFLHIVATVDLGTTGAAALYVNGALVDSGTTTGVMDDWDGGDPAGFGVNGAGIPGGTLTGSSAFTGDVAILRWYEDTMLTAGDALDHFNAVAVPEPGTWLLGGLVGLGMVLLRGRKRIGGTSN